jgi:hypothetical protein
VLSNEFNKVIARDVRSIDPDIELPLLLAGCPRIGFDSSESEGWPADYAKTVSSRGGNSNSGQFSFTEQPERGAGAQNEGKILY